MHDKHIIPILMANQSAVAMRTLPQYAVVSQTLADDMESLDGWTNQEGADPVENAVNFVTGSKSIRVTNDGVLSRMTKTLSPSVTLGANDHISIRVYPHGTYTGSYTFEFSNKLTGVFPTAKFTAGFKPNAKQDSTDTGKWFICDIGPGDVTFTGAMQWTTEIKEIRVFTNHIVDGEDASYDTLYVNIETTSTPALMITFDDGDVSQYTQAFPIFRDRNVRSTAYMISSYLDTAGYMTTAQMLALHAAGWTIGNHTKFHTSMSGLSQAQAETAFSDCEAALVAAGITGNGPKHISYPFGVHTPESDAALVAIGALTGRATTSDSAINSFNGPAFNRLYARDLGDTTTLAFAKARLDQAVASNKVATFYGHKIAEAAGVGQWAASDLEALLDYAISLDVPIITIDDFYKLHSQNVQIPIASTPA